MDQIISSAKMIASYLEANDYTVFDLAEASSVSPRTIARLLNDECRLSYEVAVGLHKLIPEISVDYLFLYDSKYQLQKKELARSAEIKNIREVIDFFRLKQLFPEDRRNSKALIERGLRLFGEDCLKNMSFNYSPLPALFSKAKGSVANDSAAWTVFAYNKCIEESENSILDFNESIFLREFDSLRILTATTSIDGALANIKGFCSKCGINFCMCNSIPNARIKGVSVRNSDGKVFILLSNLFKCVETLMIAFVHECYHNKNHDFDDPSLSEEGRTAENERTVDKETRRFFVEDYYFSEEQFPAYRAKDIYTIARKYGSAPGIVASIARCECGNFTNRYVNALLHFYSR